MPTANFYIGQEDGWVAITPAAPTEVRVTSAPYTHPYYLTASASPPAATVIGVLMCRHPFETYQKMTTGEILYAKIVTPVPDSGAMNGKLRLDVFTIT